MKTFFALRSVFFLSILAVVFIPCFTTNHLILPVVTEKAFLFRALLGLSFLCYTLLLCLDPRYKPRFSWIIAVFFLFVLSTGLSALIGILPIRSFFGEYARMDGVVSVVYVFIYFLAISHVLSTEKMWSYFFYVSIIAASLTASYGIYQHWDSPIYSRITSTIGSPALLASYLLIHLFLVALLFFRARFKLSVFLLISSLPILFYAFLLTGTRGAICGLIAGIIVSLCYGFFYKNTPLLPDNFVGSVDNSSLYRHAPSACPRDPGVLSKRKTFCYNLTSPQSHGQDMERRNLNCQHRLVFFKLKYCQRALLIGILALLTFYAVKPAAFMNSQMTSIAEKLRLYQLQEASHTRTTVWKIALKGWQERPFLGYGMNNFNYVYNKYYDPSLYYEEIWFDKAHNVLLEWLVAGGILGLFLYVSILGSSFYYLFSKKYRYRFSVSERAILSGLITAYLVQNLFLFDTLVTYIAFIPVLAFIHWRVSKQALTARPIISAHKRWITFALMPLMAMLSCGGFYVLNVPALLAAYDAGQSTKLTDHQAAYDKMHQALERNTWANFEILTQLTRIILQSVGDKTIATQDKQFMMRRTQAELQQLLTEYPFDIRAHINIANIACNIPDLSLAKNILAEARSISPKKQGTIIFQGITEQLTGNTQGAHAFFEEAYLLDKKNTEALSFYTQSSQKLQELAAL
jgi:hypothetical protein